MTPLGTGSAPHQHPPLASRLVQLAPWLFAALLMHQAVRYAWVAEDAFINLRVIAQALDGWGLVWNQGERVQVYTSPLWLLLSLGTTALVGDPAQAVVWLSLGVFAVALGLLWLACGRHTVGWLVLAALWCSSRSVRDYICSGLETPLVMMAVAAAVVAATCAPGLRASHLGTVLALCMLVRHDLALLLGPLLAWAAWLRVPGSALGATARCDVPRMVAWCGALLRGSWPFWLWSAWAWLYYGSPWPNTALAKIVQGWSGPQQAWHYWGVMQHFDPLLTALMVLSLAVLWACQSRWLWPVVLGLLLLAAYLARVGVDYMAGRFMVAPLTLCLVAMASAVHARSQAWWRAWPEAVRATLTRWPPAVATSVWVSYAAITAYPDHASWLHIAQTELLHDVVDARQSFWRISDLRTLSSQGVPSHTLYRRNGEAIRQAQADTRPQRSVYAICGIGMAGYFAPRDAQIVDPLALSDRFLAGLPVVTHRPVHIGHFERPVPRDYLAARLNPEHVFADAGLARYHQDVQLVVSAPLWSHARLGAIWRLNTGAHQRAIAAWHRHYARDAVVVPRTALRDPQPTHRQDTAEYCMGIGFRALEVTQAAGTLRFRMLIPEPYTVTP